MRTDVANPLEQLRALCDEVPGALDPRHVQAVSGLGLERVSVQCNAAAAPDLIRLGGTWAEWRPHRDIGTGPTLQRECVLTRGRFVFWCAEVVSL